ncbi:MAG: ROK family protein [Candidatus Omnitrophota bacterium]
MATKFLIGIDLGGTNLKIALVSLSYQIKDKKILSTKSFSDKSKLICAIADAVASILVDNKIARSQVLGVGIGLPGPIDAEAGFVHFFPNIPGWKNVNLKTILEKKIRIPVRIDNDANLMSLAEYRLGAAKGSKNSICLTLGTGVGAGLILENKLYRGSSFAAGELGHLPVNITGPKCNCGGIACLEAYIGNNRITQKVKNEFGRDIPLEKVSDMANQGNKKALKIWDDVALYLGRALVAVVNLLNLETVVIGGGVAEAGDLIFKGVRKIVSEQAMSVQAGRVKIIKAKLGSDAGMIGAAIFAREG